MEKFIEMFIGEHIQSAFGFFSFLIMVVALIVGIIFMFIRKRAYGFFTIANGLFYYIASFIIANNYFSLVEPLMGLVIFIIIAVAVGIFGWVKFNYFSAVRCIVTFLVYIPVVAACVIYLPLIDGQNILEAISAIKLSTWSYIAFFACLGVWIMPILMKIFVIFGIMGEISNSHLTYSNQDGVNGATGNESSVDTTSMSD